MESQTQSNETQGRKGTTNVLNKLENSVKEGSYYEAQQMYKTIYFRYLNSKKYSEAVNLLKSGATVMLDHGHLNEGTELASLLINIYNITHMPVNPSSLEPLLHIYSLYNKNNVKPDEEDSQLYDEWLRAKETFSRAALKWSMAEGESKQGSSELHELLAHDYYQLKQYSKAQKHFLRSTKPETFAKMLIEWAKQGYRGEVDLYITRAVLQYLCLANLKDANIVFSEFVRLFPESELPHTPLINFTSFLLRTLERDAFPLFDMLRKRYKPSLDRDPSFQQHLDQIGFVFFKVKPPSGGNFFADLIKSMMSE